MITQTSASLLTPHFSEKSQALAQAQNIYVFRVDLRLNHNQIKQFVEDEYKVNVIKLRTAVIKGKKSRSIRLGSRSSRPVGRRSDFKKAFVVVKAGQTIPVFVDTAAQESK